MEIANSTQSYAMRYAVMQFLNFLQHSCYKTRDELNVFLYEHSYHEKFTPLKLKGVEWNFLNFSVTIANYDFDFSKKSPSVKFFFDGI